MTSRRFLLFTAASLAALPVVTRAAATPEAAHALVQATARELAAIVNGSDPLSAKQAKLRRLVDANVDVDGVGRFCLGRFWRVATPEQQKAYLALFHEVLMDSIMGKLGEYQGVQIAVGGAATRDEGVVVSSTVTQPNNPPANVDWVVDVSGSGPKIVDLIAEGTSLRLTQRSDYSAYITRHGNSVDALLAAMKGQVQGGSRSG